jgi:hypothetical protein
MSLRRNSRDEAIFLICFGGAPRTSSEKMTGSGKESNCSNAGMPSVSGD